MTGTDTQHSIPNPIWARILTTLREGKVLVVTGAGVSAESGIPTFRSADGTGVYENDDEFNPIEFLRSETVEHSLDRLWDYYFTRFTGAMKDAKPNPAHEAISDAELILQDRFLLVTQNIDGLHLEAGNSPERTIELHGNKMMRCSHECWIRNNNGEAKLTPLPETRNFPEDFTCPDCGSLMRPHVLLFDEYYSQELYRSDEANAWAQETDLIITVGCSAVVPVAQILANLAVQNGAIVIDVNPADEGPLVDLAKQTGVHLADVELLGAAGEVLPELMDFCLEA